MAEKRRNRRYPKRIKVEFGEKDFSHSAYTHDISKSGAFITSSRFPPPGSHIHVKLIAEDGRWFACEAEVRWAKDVPPPLRQLQRGGFGVRFLLPDELIFQLLPQLKHEERFEVLYKTQAEFDAAMASELRHGGVFVRTEAKLPPETDVTLEIRLEFAMKNVELPARVFQVIPGGIAFLLTDRQVALQALNHFAKGKA